MNVFLGLCGRRVFLEHARWASPDRFFEIRRENGETLIWLGRLHVIYTPARWSAPRGRLADERPHPS